jgi:hypothetical protein
MGITDTDITPHSTKGDATLYSFSDSFRINDGRAVVSLPKKKHVIPADKSNLLGRFRSLTKRFDTDPDFKTMYENKTMDYILQHHIEVPPPELIFSPNVLPAALCDKQRKTYAR